jgi:1,4-dihydroxy-2-naphthoate octaprenyltransferase
VKGAKLAPPKPATLGTWIAGARPLTLVLALVPVALGTAAAAQVMTNWYDHWARALLCLAVAVFLQIAVNYANDYSDGVRGTDRDRVGPQRLVGSGRAKPRTVFTVALVFFALAAVAGAVLVWRTEQWWLLAVGAVCLIAGWFYTGGKRPYGYLGLGELAVFVFFGVVPTAGTMFVQVGEVNIEAWLAGAAAGLFAAAVLVANNARDRERDKLHGKRTLAVLLGGLGTRILYVVLMLAPFGILAFFAIFYEPGSGSGFAPYVYFAGVAALPAILIATTARATREWVLVMRLTLVTTLLYGLGLAAAIVLPGALL